MFVPETFVFSQNNLQDYVDCSRRFYLRYIQKLQWPAVESEPIKEHEELIELGTRFHLLCQQYFLGVPIENLIEQIDLPELSIWWQNFLDLDLRNQPGIKLAEKMLSMPFAGFRLAAKIDLLLIQPKHTVTIYDWKTSKHQPSRKNLLERMQSKIYPLVLSRIELYTPVSVDQIEMNYWYPAFPQQMISLSYSENQQKNDWVQLESIIKEISSKIHKDEFPLTEEIKKCAFCRYRSFCERGSQASYNDEQEFDMDINNAFDLDFDTL